MSVAKRMLEEQDAYNEMRLADRMAEDDDPISVAKANDARLAKSVLEDKHAVKAAAEAAAGVDDIFEAATNCCVCDAKFGDESLDNYETMGDGVECYYCCGRVCPDCIDHDAPHAIGEYDLEEEIVCKSCCINQVKLRSDREQAEEDASISAFEDHPE